jgi:hypothetical protein
VTVEKGRRDQICPFWDEVLAEVWGDDWKDIWTFCSTHR